MEIDDCLAPFKETILLDQAFEECETSLGDQSVNELSIHGLETLTIQFKENKLSLSSATPFRLNRTREKLVINHEPLINVNSWNRSFLRVSISAPRRYGDERDPPKKTYENRYRDEAYMQSLVTSGELKDVVAAAAITTLEERIVVVSLEHNERLNDMVLDELIHDGRILATQRELFHMTLSGACKGFFKQEEIEHFRITKQAYREAHGDIIASSLLEEIARVKKWGAIGEADMLRRMKNDGTLYANYNEVNASKRTEWILHGSELHNLRFFNLKEGVKYVDFYNRSFQQRPIAYGTHTTLKPYEHMRVNKGGAPVLVTPIDISYSVGF